MSYEKQTWASGDTISANKLNHMEDGIADGGGGGGVLVVHAIHDDQTGVATLDKTWQEIHDATLAIIVVDVNNDGTLINVEYIMSIRNSDTTYALTSLAVGLLGTTTATYTCNSPDAYPMSQSHE